MSDTPTIQTRNQVHAERAFRAVETRKKDMDDKHFRDYASFAKSFPAIIQNCGLCQALAFADKKHGDLLADLVNILEEPGVIAPAGLQSRTRTCPVTEYLRLTRMAMAGSVWIKRYAESLAPAEPPAPKEA